ncbi:MFS general substrate transporter [Jackrogersella minutella]|nr:MFS general substrate transporter [Jackrogersella minutella]
MALNIYWAGLLILLPLVALFSGHKAIFRPFRTAKLEKEPNPHDAEVKAFRMTFLRVYLLVMGSEWLQGPYLYSLLRDEKGLDERTVATLYVATYVSAAISAFLTGYMADKFGRMTACLIFCCIHSLASVSMKFNDIKILIAGRVLGGIGLTLLWTAFESWMVTEYNARGLDRSPFQLSGMFSIMTKYNCMTAILAGVVSHYIVLALGSKTNPFIVGVGLDACAFILMLWTWNENKGTNGNNSGLGDEDGLRSDTTDYKPAKATASMLKDTRIWVLSFTSCCFEGTIFIFTFFWPETLQEAHNKDNPSHGEAIPYGVIFATFMATMVLGAISFSFFKLNVKNATTERALVFSTILPTLLLSTTLLVGASSFLIAALSKTELHSYLAFLLLELCNGIYVPSIAYHRSMIVDDSHRTLIYGLMNIPLFIFVVVALYTASNNGEEHRQTVFVSSAVLLLVAAVATALGLGISSIRPGFLRIWNKNTDDINLAEKDELEPSTLH